MKTVAAIILSLTFSIAAQAEAINSGPQNISPTGEMWVCVKNIAKINKCGEGEQANGCAGNTKTITIAPRLRIFSSEPVYPEDNESCARIY